MTTDEKLASIIAWALIIFTIILLFFLGYLIGTYNAKIKTIENYSVIIQKNNEIIKGLI